MLKKYINPKFIIILSSILAIGELLNDLFYSTHNFSVMEIKQLFDPLNLDLAFNHHYRYNGLNYINAIFYLLLLLGVIAFVASKNKQSRLIQFVYSVIFFSNILAYVYSLLFYVFKVSFFRLELKNILLDIAFFSVQAIWIYVSYHVLQYFNERKELQCIEAEDGTGQTYFVTASIAQRWLHPVVDRLVTLVLFSPIIDFFMNLNIKNFTNAAILPATILFSILFYYLLYETVLGITPAKLITQTRVVGYNDKKPSFKTIFIRTICRLVPFEAFSFFAEDGWHDKWSQTVVVKEQDISLPIQTPSVEYIKA